MYKVLIVDDEPIAVEAVEFMIKKNFAGAGSIEKSRSGKEAIEKAYQLHPDVIIMDINMPGINGLEAMRQIRQEIPSVSFIVISAFDYFDYAVEAVALGVEGYLLKPVKEAKFVETFRRVLDQIDRNSRKRRETLEQQERLEKIIPILEAGFMNSLCMYGQDTSILKNYCDLFDYRSTGGYVLAIEFGQKDSKGIENKIGAGVHGEKMYEEYKNIIKGMANCFVSPVMLNRIIVYIFDDGEEGEYEQKARSVRTAQKMIERASRLYPDIFIGIGSYHPDVENAKKSYQGALHTLRVLAASDTVNENLSSHILHEDDIIDQSEALETDYEQLIESEIYSRVSEGEDAAVLLSFEQLYQRMCINRNMGFDTLKKWMIGLVAGFEKHWGSVLGTNYLFTLGDIIGAKDREELFTAGKRYLNEALHKISSGRQSKANSIIEKADRYILEHFNEDISLDEIARHVNLSPYYFSRFYKSSTGTSFIDRLVAVRMERARELLKREELSVKDVAYMVGYADPNYFSKIFKKSTGYNASEYKKL